jgi:formamidopyrimidine-DNA glycosylase
MPELPEVETTVRDLKKKVLGRTFVDSWTDFPKNIKKPKNFRDFAAGIKNRKILDAGRRAKNILIYLSGGKIMLIHQKMTGHLLLGKWKKENNRWLPLAEGPISQDPRNGFLHLILFLDDGCQLALSDMRKFAKIELWDKASLENSEYFKTLGPEPLEKDFTLKKFREILPHKGKIKQILMDQTVISGIGNIYADEILWASGIRPERDVSSLNPAEIKKIHLSIKEILLKSIRLKGDSFSDYRLLSGEKGGYQNVQNVYRREKKLCPRGDKGVIQRIKIGGRSAHFCPKCQK